MKFFTVLAAAAAIFTGFVAASPIAAAAPAPVAVPAPSLAQGAELVPRGDAAKSEKDIIAILLALHVDIDGCNKKWTDRCKNGGCGQSHVREYAVEVAALINIRVAEIKAKIFVGLKIVDINLVVRLVAELLVKINVTLNLLCGGLGLVGALLVNLLLILCVDLRIAINALIACLAVVVDGLLIKVQVLLGGLLGGLLCLVCSLLGWIL